MQTNAAGNDIVSHKIHGHLPHANANKVHGFAHICISVFITCKGPIGDRIAKRLPGEGGLVYLLHLAHSLCLTKSVTLLKARTTRQHSPSHACMQSVHICMYTTWLGNMAPFVYIQYEKLARIDAKYQDIIPLASASGAQNLESKNQKGDTVTRVVLHHY